MPDIVTIRVATRDDLPALHPVIERAYRGETARGGWTHEADLIEGARTDITTLAAIVEDPAQRLLIALAGRRDDRLRAGQRSRRRARLSRACSASIPRCRRAAMASSSSPRPRTRREMPSTRATWR
jgi:hypothetical protein